MNNLVHNGDEPIGLRDKWEYNQDFKLDWHDGKEAHDGYQLKWVGKNYARLQTGTKTETVIIPDTKHNEKEINQNSENLFFTGDNLEVLKHLQNAYAGKIKMIYIDPPYNTGSEFVYPDSFSFSDEQLKNMLGYSDEDIKRLHSINGKSSHSAWLTFMYPRLKIAKQLLTEDGVIFISIDDNEQANLKLLCDEIFGEANFIAKVNTVANPGGRDYSEIAVQHEYILIYGKSINSELNELPKNVEFKLFDDLGGFELRDLRNRNPKFNNENRPNLYYPIYIDTHSIDRNGFFEVLLTKKHNDDIEVYPLNSKGAKSVWRWGKEKLSQNLFIGNIDKSQIVAKSKKSGGYTICEKCRKVTTRVKSIWDETTMRTEEGTRQINNLFGFSAFPHPKPFDLVVRCIMLALRENDWVLDFFAGSATTAHAVLKNNAEGNNTHKFMMIQLPEAIFESKSHTEVPKNNCKDAYENGFRTIDQISRKRIELAAEKIKNDTGKNIDYGFKHYYVQAPNVNTIDKILEFDPNENKMLPDDMVGEFDCETAKGEDVILTTWLVDDGYEINTKIEQLKFGDYTAHYVDNQKLYLIQQGWGTSQTKELLERIGKFSLNVSTIIIYGYSFNLESLSELEINVKTNLENRITIEKRY